MIRISYEQQDNDTLRRTKLMVLNGQVIYATVSIKDNVFRIKFNDTKGVIFASCEYKTLNRCKRELRKKLIELGVHLYDEVRDSKYK